MKRRKRVPVSVYRLKVTGVHMMLIGCLLEVGTIVYWNNVCWYIGATTNENENYLLNFEEYSVCEECVGCNAIADCPGGWITCKVSPCCDGAPELPQGAITFEGNACTGDGVIVDGVCYTITTVSDGQASGALIVTQDDIISDICSNFISRMIPYTNVNTHISKFSLSFS